MFWLIHRKPIRCPLYVSFNHKEYFQKSVKIFRQQEKSNIFTDSFTLHKIYNIYSPRSVRIAVNCWSSGNIYASITFRRFVTVTKTNYQCSPLGILGKLSFFHDAKLLFGFLLVFGFLLHPIKILIFGTFGDVYVYVKRESKSAHLCEMGIKWMGPIIGIAVRLGMA